ncbi:dolichol-phosphate mannosyltransferase subunit 3 [Coturnix japonica]|uniref:Dolichol-phosphate mannosyltransferase subunit 3 n=1 Tax=Coturnix japonica TaxID=93934 RepID=A0A8C2SLY5_COTJA|nr:dolichol-phosphate mannosyltransferase subunit 3 [Coturnix japonica]
MTKLAQWLLVLALLGSCWVALVLAPFSPQLPVPVRQVLLPLPIYLLVVSGCFSLAAVGFRVATFNDCPEAAAELRGHIAMARADLRLRGMDLNPQ